MKPLLSGHAPSSGERIGVGHGDHPVDHAGIVRRRPEVFADAFHQIRASAPTGVNRPLRVGPDHFYLGALFFEVAADPADGTAGADAGHQVGDAVGRLAPDLRTGRTVVSGRVLRVAVLVRLERSRR